MSNLKLAAASDADLIGLLALFRDLHEYSHVMEAHFEGMVLAARFEVMDAAGGRLNVMPAREPRRASAKVRESADMELLTRVRDGLKRV